MKTGQVTDISLDHDLGDDERGTGYDVVLWIEEAVFSEGFQPPRMVVHSANSSAREKMERGIRKIGELVKNSIEKCPICRSNQLVRRKHLMIDPMWEALPGIDPRLRYCTDLRVDDIKEQHRSEVPLEQIINGYYCDHCGKGFVSEDQLNSGYKYNSGS